MPILPIALAACALLPNPAPVVEEGETHHKRVAVEWYDGSFDHALHEAKQSEHLVMVALTPTWSEYSNKLVDEVMTVPEVAERLGRFVAVRFDDDSTVNAQRIKQQYAVQSIPSLLFISSDGAVEDTIYGFIGPDQLLYELDRILRGEDTVSDRRARAEAHPDDLEARYALASKLSNCGDEEAAGPIIAEIRAADPRGETVTGARILRQDVWGTCSAIEGNANGALDTTPVSRHLKRVALPAAAFEGWNELANYLANTSRAPEARSAFRQAWRHIDDDGKMGWSHGVAMWLLDAEDGDEFSSDDRRFALAVAETAVECADAFCHGGEGMGKDEGESEEWSEYDKTAWLAGRIDLLAQVKFRYGTAKDRKEAIELARQCNQMAPDNEEYGARLASFEDAL